MLVQLSTDHEEIRIKYRGTEKFRIEAGDGVHKQIQQRVCAYVE